MEIKQIPLSKIVMENIDPFLEKDQVVETKLIRFQHSAVFTANSLTHWKVTLYYAHKEDSMMVSVHACMGPFDPNPVLLQKFKGARMSYNRTVEIFEGRP